MPELPRQGYVEADVDHGGRTYSLLELELPACLRLREGELSALVHAHTRLEINLDDMEGAVADLERSGRPVWAAQLARRLRWLRELEAKVAAEIGLAGP